MNSIGIVFIFPRHQDHGLRANFADFRIEHFSILEEFRWIADSFFSVDDSSAERALLVQDDVVPMCFANCRERGAFVPQVFQACASESDHFRLDVGAVKTFRYCFYQLRHVVEVSEAVSDEQNMNPTSDQVRRCDARLLLAKVGIRKDRQ